MRTKQEIKEFLEGLDTPVDVLMYVSIWRIDQKHPFESIYDMIIESGGFDIDVAHYEDAVKYLGEHDPSWNKSVSLAVACGYTEEDIDAELLARLLLSENTRRAFCSLRPKINNFFKD
jgi:hypothetical protein